MMSATFKGPLPRKTRHQATGPTASAPAASKLDDADAPQPAHNDPGVMLMKILNSSTKTEGLGARVGTVACDSVHRNINEVREGETGVTLCEAQHHQRCSHSARCTDAP